MLTLACASALTACDGDSGKPPHSLGSPGSPSVSSTSTPAAPAPSPTTASPATDPAAERLVLRWRETGGFAGKGGPGTLPEFSLYSTGRAVVASEGRATEYRLKPEALQRLLDEARAAGLARSHTSGPGRVMDAIVLEFTMGRATTKIIQPEAQSDPAVRFRERLDPRRWPPGDLVSPGRPYAPAKVAVLSVENPGAETVKKWPLAPLGKGERVPGGVCTLAPASKVPAARPDVGWRSQGRTYTVRVRPLLPGESSCRDIA
ncbi:hypothetical protein [Actinomadura litoris]|uniref:hypothetical protein n=1 Tax=Actinomadura litoris TaxID=2678616 RepID=UPI001FA7751E|nr:hypothetical protein [Actinomadura litoris]